MYSLSLMSCAQVIRALTLVLSPPTIHCLLGKEFGRPRTGKASVDRGRRELSSQDVPSIGLDWKEVVKSVGANFPAVVFLRPVVVWVSEGPGNPGPAALPSPEEGTSSAVLGVVALRQGFPSDPVRNALPGVSIRPVPKVCPFCRPAPP
jgi:hypothetical protein